MHLGRDVLDGGVELEDDLAAVVVVLVVEICDGGDEGQLRRAVGHVLVDKLVPVAKGNKAAIERMGNLEAGKEAKLMLLRKSKAN